MRDWYRQRAIEIAIALTLTVIAVSLALVRKAGAEQAELAVTNAWARPTVGVVGVVYFTVISKSDRADTLLSAVSAVAGAVELHETRRDGDVMGMRRLEAGLPIPPRATVRLAPAGVHLMLTDLKRHLEEGSNFPLTLTFAHQGAVEVEVSVNKTPPRSD